LLENLTEDELSRYALSTVTKVAPTSKTEKKLQSVWAAALGLDPGGVGIHDHFLHSGGDSFTAMRLVSLANMTGISLTVADVFQHPKLADLAGCLDQKAESTQQAVDEIPPLALWKDIQVGEARHASIAKELGQLAAQCRISAADIEDVYPCTPLQEGLMAITAQQPRAYIGRWAFKMPDTIDATRFQNAWRDLVRVAPILRTRIVPGRLSGALQVVVREELLWSTGSDLEEYLDEDAAKSITYGAPLVRPAIINASNKQRYFVLVAHHSTFDGWSLTKLFECVLRLYAKEDIPVVPPFTRFIQYLDQQSQPAAESFWMSQLDGDIGAPFPAPPNPSYQPQPSQHMTSELEVRPTKSSITLATLLQASWALALSAHCGSSVLFASPLSGRAAPVMGILDMLGPTITTVPMCIRLDMKQTVNRYLADIQQQVINMMPFEHTGLQHIRRFMGSDLNLGHMFAVQPARERENLISGRPLGLEQLAIPMQNFDAYALTVECITGLDRESIVQVEARFDRDVITNSDVKRLLSRFRHIVGQLLRIHADGESGKITTLGDVEIVSPEEIAQIAEWNSPITEKKQTLVHDLVHQQALIRPGSPAVCSHGMNLPRL
jgi:hypothetical protein